MTNIPAVELKNVSFAYEGKHPVLDDISFFIERGESVGIIGANGTGKSTLMKLLVGLLDAKGSISINGKELNKGSIADVRRIIGYVLQDSDNQLFMPTLYDDIAFAPRNYGLSKNEVEARVDEALEKTEITHLKNRQNYKLSGGEKRMACIATVLAMKPEIIIMDEPTITLDPYNRRNLINLLNRMDETKILASHDLDMILETCGKVILIDKGRILAMGSACDILGNKELLISAHMELPLCFQDIVPYKKQRLI